MTTPTAPVRPETPELDRRSKILEEAHRLGEFLDWLRSDRGYTLCWRSGDKFYPAHMPEEQLLADFYGIDLDKVEQERRALLDYMRAVHEKEDANG